MVNLIGGCCGTTPDYIKHVHDSVKGLSPRVPFAKSKTMMLSGMSEFVFKDHIKFVNIGERCNISGSLKFKKLIKNDEYEKAIAIAKEQVENGA